MSVYGGVLKKISIDGTKLTFEIGKNNGKPELETWDLKECEVHVDYDFWNEMLGLRVGLVKPEKGKPFIHLCRISDLTIKPI